MNPILTAYYPWKYPSYRFGMCNAWAQAVMGQSIAAELAKYDARSTRYSRSYDSTRPNEKELRRRIKKFHNVVDGLAKRRVCPLPPHTIAHVEVLCRNMPATIDAVNAVAAAVETMNRSFHSQYTPDPRTAAGGASYAIERNVLECVPIESSTALMIQMRWRIMDALRGRMLPKGRRQAFEAIWLAGEFETAYTFARQCKKGEL